jgi:hypothetical protein
MSTNYEAPHCATFSSLPIHYHKKNSVALIDDLKKHIHSLHTRICLFDTENTHANIQPAEIYPITTDILKHIAQSTQHSHTNCWNSSILSFLRIYSNSSQTVTSKKPEYLWDPLHQLSQLNIFLQYLEHKKITPTLQSHNIAVQHRYVDDILMIHNEKSTQIQSTLQYFNRVDNNLNFTMELDKDKNSSSWTSL